MSPQAPRGSNGAHEAGARKRSKLEELMEQDKAAKKAKADRAAGNGAPAGTSGRQDAPWLLPGITVKVCPVQLRGHGPALCCCRRLSYVLVGCCSLLGVTDSLGAMHGGDMPNGTQAGEAVCCV